MVFLEWVEFNPTMLCQSPFLKVQPEIKGKYTGCTYCYAAAGMPHTAEELDRYKARELSTAQILDFLKKISSVGVKRLAVLGGEPQIRLDFDEVFSYAVSVIPLVQLTTNGIGTPRYLATLKKIPWIDVSLDSNDIDITAKMRPREQAVCALETINLLHDKHPYLCINCVVTPYNYDTVPDYIDWAFSQRNIKRVNLYPLLNEEYGRALITSQQADVLAVELTKRFLIRKECYCKSGKHVVVDSDGKVYPCAAFFGTGVSLGCVEQIETVCSNDILKKFSEYDFKKYAADTVKSFESPSCPGKKLYDSGWLATDVPKKEPVIPKTYSVTYCLRCGSETTQDANICKYCDFDKFDDKAFNTVCGCFSVLNPKYHH